MKILAIVGSVSLAGNQEALERIEEVLERHKPDKVISGGAAGIDTMAVRTAERKNIPYQEFPPQVQRWRKGLPDGFEARNKMIAEACTHLVRIVVRNSKTYGSGWTRDMAKKLGKPTEEFIIG